ncbi:monosaccharide ABC transporter membrane protein (CUT2 family) [Bacillus oleivorans]|uniref:Monosaccharide ABC transporter membrane protein (CUT2 family) n=1 Tax=Bacillus oleivorans TaxID=1448271 RepID=A0A285CQT2_9BACI|nr:ABC transporter permease [Bacillus oleivorans]SNX69428.1 monosaccharide ABC transporter membrane protein (CUT2 family) [Bacillus oleivorans]
MKRLLKTNEFYVTIVLVLLIIYIGSQNSAFLSINNWFDLIRSAIVPVIFVIGTLLVLISGGIDVSFPAIAALSMYTTTSIITNTGYDGPVIVAFMISALIGLLLGFINAIFIAFLKLPALIVTLGTASIYSGFLLTFIDDGQITRLPEAMTNLSKTRIFEITTETGMIGIPVVFLITIAIVILGWFLLKYSMLGRSIYALGGDEVSAERMGISPVKVKVFVYCFVGTLAGIAGMIHTIMGRNSNASDLLGGELLIIAAVVLGGARITGGHGTIYGSLVALLLILIIENSLILLGIPSYWQRFVIGALILIGTGFSAVQVKRSLESRNPILTE